MNGLNEPTPGPWTVVKNDDSSLFITAPWSKDVDPGTSHGFADYRGVHVAEVHHHSGDGAAPLSHAQANARLLALAPELYDALKQIADRIDAMNGVVTWSPREHSRLVSLLDRALPQPPHCEHHQQFEYDCLDCSDALQKTLAPLDKCPRCKSVRGYCSCELAHND